MRESIQFVDFTNPPGEHTQAVLQNALSVYSPLFLPSLIVRQWKNDGKSCRKVKYYFPVGSTLSMSERVLRKRKTVFTTKIVSKEVKEIENVPIYSFWKFYTFPKCRGLFKVPPEVGIKSDSGELNAYRTRSGKSH